MELLETAIPGYYFHPTTIPPEGYVRLGANKNADASLKRKKKQLNKTSCVNSIL